MGKNKSKKSGTSEAFAHKKQRQHTKTSTAINPFEVHTNREKISVLGRKLKHDKGMPGISRTKATKKRKETLGREFLQKNKSNTFRDNRVARFTASAADAANARFIAERLQQFNSRKQSRFNLNENEDTLTHKGQTLEEIEQYHDTISDDEDDDEIGRLDAEFTDAAHFGGRNIDADGKHRKGAIEDLIADTKRRKVEISMEKEQVSQMTTKLDESWRNLLSLMDLKTDQDDSDKPKPDDFDRALKEMVFERRGTVTDKLGTEEKLLRKAKWELEQLEKARQTRMHGLTEEELKPKHRSADDLDDGYFMQTDFEEVKPLAYDADGKANRNDDDSDEELDRLIAESKRSAQLNGEEEDDESEEEDGEEGGSGDEEGEEEGEEESEGESGDNYSDLEDDSNSEEDDAEDEKEVQHKSKQKEAEPKPKGGVSVAKKPADKVLTDEERQAMIEKAKKELPYTFELSDSYEALRRLLHKHSPDHQAIILERMIKCNHPTVEPANKERMVYLFAFLLQYINDVAAEDPVLRCFTIVDRFTPFLYDLSHINPAETTRGFLEVIKEKQGDYKQMAKKTYPKLDSLIFLKIVSSLYSTSDFRHTIVSPCNLFISQILTYSRVATRSDIASGLFIVSVVMEYTEQSQRFLPAAVNFLAGVLFLCVRKRKVELLKALPPFKSSGALGSLLVLKQKNTDLSNDDYRLQASDFSVTDIDDSFRIRAFNTAVTQANAMFSRLKICALQQLVEPFSRLLDRIERTNYPEVVNKNVSTLLLTIDHIKSEPLTYLVPEVKKPKTLRQLEPKFEPVFEDRRRGNKDAGKYAERKDLQRKIKKEQKGAAREIRRDNAFLSKIQHKRRMQRCVFGRVFKLFTELSFEFDNDIFHYFFFTAIWNERIRFVVYSPRHPFNKVSLMLSIERKNICNKVPHFISSKQFEDIFHLIKKFIFFLDQHLVCLFITFYLYSILNKTGHICVIDGHLTIVCTNLLRELLVEVLFRVLGIRFDGSWVLITAPISRANYRKRTHLKIDC